MQKQSFEESLASLKQKGIRMTPQRQLVLQTVKNAKNHPTADEVHREICKTFENLSIASVYNSLDLFVNLGLIGKITNGDDSSRFDGNNTEHAHLVCNSCGTMHDIDLPDVSGFITEEVKGSSFQLDSVRLEIVGTCKECQVKKTA